MLMVAAMVPKSNAVAARPTPSGLTHLPAHLQQRKNPIQGYSMTLYPRLHTFTAVASAVPLSEDSIPGLFITAKHWHTACSLFERQVQIMATVFLPKAVGVDQGRICRFCPVNLSMQSNASRIF